MRNLRLHNTILTVAMPIVVRLLAIEVSQRVEVECILCKKMLLCDWKVCCIVHRFSASHCHYPEILRNINSANKNFVGENLIISRMDIGNVDKLFQNITEGKHISDQHPEVLNFISARNCNSHISELSDVEYATHFDNVRESCITLFDKLLLGKSKLELPLVNSISTSKMLLTLLDQCKKSWTSLQVEEYALRHYRRCASLHAAHTADVEGLATGFKIQRTNSLVEKLADDSESKDSTDTADDNNATGQSATAVCVFQPCAVGCCA